MMLGNDKFINLLNLPIYGITINWFLGNKLEFRKNISKINRYIASISVVLITTYILWKNLNKTDMIMPTESITLIPSFIYLLIYKKGSIWEKLYLISTYIIVIFTINIIFGNAYVGIMELCGNNVLAYSELSMRYIIILKIIAYLIGLFVFSTMFKYIKLKDNTILPIITVSNMLMASVANLLMKIFPNAGKGIGVESFFISITILFSHFLLIIILNISYEKSKKLIIAESNLNKLEADLKHNEEIRTIYNEMSQWRHDWQNHLNIVMYMLREKRNEEAYVYLHKISKGINFNRKYKSFIKSDNTILEATLNSKIIIAIDKNIKVNTAIDIKEHIYINDLDLCELLGNLLDNSIEGCERIEREKFINIKIISVNSNLIIVIQNSMDGNINFNGNKYYSSKRKGVLGRGISQIDKIVDKYDGVVYRKHCNCLFETKIVMRNLNKYVD